MLTKVRAASISPVDWHVMRGTPYIGRMVFVSQRFVMYVMKPSHDDLTVMGDLMATGKVHTVIDRRYPLHQVPQAIQYLEEGHARGKVVVDVQ